MPSTVTDGFEGSSSPSTTTIVASASSVRLFCTAKLLAVRDCKVHTINTTAAAKTSTNERARHTPGWFASASTELASDMWSLSLMQARSRR